MPSAPGILCPHCGHPETPCVDSRPREDGTRARRYKCAACSKTFGTMEKVRDQWMPQIAKYHVGQKVRTRPQYPFRFRGVIVSVYVYTPGTNKYVVLNPDGVDLAFWATELEEDV